MKKLLLVFVIKVLLQSTVFASSVNLEAELEQIANRYSLSPSKYSESLTEHYNHAVKLVGQALQEATANGKKLGIVVGENHESEGAKCFEMLLLQVALQAGIQQALFEITPENFDLCMEQGYNLGAQVGYLQRLVKEAKRLKMQVHAVDKNVVETEHQDPLDEIKEAYLTGEERELYTVEKICGLGESFVFYTGANHLATPYYSPELNDKFSLIFLNCSFPDSEKNKQFLDRIILMINDANVLRIHAQRKRFLTETEHSHKCPIMLNERNSFVCKMLLETEDHIMGVNLQEIRGYDPTAKKEIKDEMEAE